MNINVDSSQIQKPVVLNTTPPEAKQENAPQAAEQKDSAELSSGESVGKKIISFPGKVIKGVMGVATGTVEAGLGVIPSTFGGITSALGVRPKDPSGQYGPYKGDAEGGYTVAYVLQAGAAGATVGAMLGGPWMAAAGGVGGLIVGGVKMAVDHSTGSMKRIGDKIEDATFEPILDNTPTGDKMYDAGKNVSEGGILGMKAGVKENFSTGFEKAGGTMSGLWEGSKGAVRTFAHSEPQAPAPETEKPSFGQQVKNAAMFVLALPKNIVKVAAGIVGGVVGTAMMIPNGLIEGIGQGASHHGNPEHISMSKSGHRALIRLESAALGAAAGFAAAPWGTVISAVGGGVAGLIVGFILTRIEKSTDTDDRIIANMENHMKREIADNKDLGSKIANGHRNVIEGAMVGTAAGMKEGFSVGYDVGAGFVQGVADGIKGVGKGIVGGFKAASHPQTPKPQETLNN